MTKKILPLLLTAIIFCSPIASLAQDMGEAGQLLERAAGTEGAGYDTATQSDESAFARIIGGIVRVALSLVGIIFISYTIYGGYLWLTSAGNEEKISRAKDIIKNGIIGLIVIFASAAIYYFVVGALTQSGSPASSPSAVIQG